MAESRTYGKSEKLLEVGYDIRGPVLDAAKRLEEEGYKLIKLNIGNPAPFGFDAPDELFHDMIVNLRDAQGYSDSKGIFPARKAVMQHYQTLGVHEFDTERIYMGNGVSELIVMAMQALLNSGDEVLVPAPDYPLWTAAVTLAGGKAVHYRCDEENDWLPDLDDLKAKVSDKTRGVVVINPNNPTGAVYPKDLLEQMVQLAEERHIPVFADEIYAKILYDDAVHVPLSSLVKGTLCVTFNGLSKSYRAAGFRVGWMALSGDLRNFEGYRQGIDMLSNMRLCSNVPGQMAVQAALGGYQSIEDLILPTGRLGRQRDIAYDMLSSITGVTVRKPKGALYLFPRLDPKRYPIASDEKFALDLLLETKVLVVHGSGFNLKTSDHFRVVFLPNEDQLRDAMERIGRFLETYRP